jgi:hypothetical protein
MACDLDSTSQRSELEGKRRGDRLKGKKREKMARGVNEWDVCRMEQSKNEGGIDEAGWVGTWARS